MSIINSENMELKHFKGQCAEGFVAQTLIDKIAPSTSGLPLKIEKIETHCSMENTRKTRNIYQNLLVGEDVHYAAPKRNCTFWCCTVYKLPLCFSKVFQWCRSFLAWWDYICPTL